MLIAQQQQNQTNRDRGMDSNAAWPGPIPPGEKSVPDATATDYTPAEGANNVQPSTDVNYMYSGSQTPHNGTGTSESY